MSVIVYTKDNCIYCNKAKGLLKNWEISYTEIHLDSTPESAQRLFKETKRMTFPQIIVNDKVVGGYDDLAKLSREQFVNF